MIRLQRASVFSAVFAAVFCTPLLANASTRRHDVPAADYTSLGAQYTTVGGVLVGASFGSATLIGTNWILTAAHVPGALTSGSFFLNGNTYAVTNIVRDPLWSGSVGIGGHDFALGFIAGGVAGVTPSGYYAGADELGKVGTSVGFGLTGTGLTGATGLGAKRGFQNVIDGRDIDPGLAGLIADFDKPDGSTNTLGSIGSSPTPLGLEGNAAQGDSGGGLFADFFGTQLLVGVTSYAAQADFNAGDPIGNLGSRADGTGGWAG